MIENNYYNLPYIHGHFAYTIGFNPRHKEIFPTMDETTIARTIFDTFPGTRATTVWGDTFFYYNPDPDRPDEFYFATLKSADDEYDNASDLNRPGAFRLNIGVGKETFFSLFESRPSRPGAEADFDAAYDFTAADRLMPHPVYGRQYWVCVVNPGAATFAALRPLLDEAYGLAVEKFNKKGG